MEGRLALDTALDLARMPALAAVIRAQPLPPDALVLIRIAAGCQDTCGEAARLTGKSAAFIREAAVLYLQQVLFSPDSDCFRLLGVPPGASKQQMRDHMRWLMRWLHPDHNQNEWESVFAARVLSAWREAGELRRSSVMLDIRPARKRRGRFRQPGHRWVALPLEPNEVLSAKRRRRFVAATVAGVLILIGLIPIVVASSSELQTTGGMQADAAEHGR